MTEPLMARGKGDGIGLQLALWEGDGTPVVCVHGLTANWRSLQRIADALAPEHRVIGYDLRGRGLSDKPESGYSVDHHARDIAALLDHLGLDRADLIGHSLGAAIVAAFAAKRPERVGRIVLVDGAGKLNRRQAGRVLKGLAPSIGRLGRRFPSIDAYLDTVRQSPFFRPWNPVIEGYFRYEMEEVEGGVIHRASAAHIAEELGNLIAVDMPSVYRQIRCPVLILRAGEGLLGPGTALLPKNALLRMVAEIERVSLLDLERSNHYSIVFQENRIRDRAIAGFLSPG